jgi:hypothetical protein
VLAHKIQSMLPTTLIFAVFERWLIYGFNKLGEVF